MAKNGSKKTDSRTDSKIKPVCGLVMPISAIGGCPEQHWADVKEILFDAVESAEFNPNLVSDADDVGIIHRRIIQNLYENPIVVCDVSAKNPNVMFELGLRLAFDKATIIVKDDLTEYSFDTAVIEHIEYPRDLRFNKIVAFKEKLKAKIAATHKKATEDTSFSPFLKHFGTFTVAGLDTKEVSRDDYVLQEIKSLRDLVLRREQPHEFTSRASGPAKMPFSRRVRFAVKRAADSYRIGPSASVNQVQEILPMLRESVLDDLGHEQERRPRFDNDFASAIDQYFDNLAS